MPWIKNDKNADFGNSFLKLNPERLSPVFKFVAYVATKGFGQLHHDSATSYPITRVI